MVGKKVISNIPSLSSLLLAGFVLGSNCGGDKGAQGTAAGVSAQAAGNSGDDAVVQSIAAEKREPVVQMLKAIIECKEGQELSYLKLASLKLVDQKHMNVEEGEALRTELERLCKELGATKKTAFPEEIRKYLEMFSELRFAHEFTTTLLPGYVKNKVLWAKLINLIVGVRNEFSRVFQGAKGVVGGNEAPVDKLRKLGKLLDELKAFYQDKVMDGSHSRFADDYKFTRDKTEKDKGHPDLKREGLFMLKFMKKCGVLEEVVGDTWIIGKSEAQNQFLPKGDVTVNEINKRGCGISDSFKIYDSSQGKAMFEVLHINNAITDSDKDPNNPTLPIIKSENLSFGQILFTLFRGEEARDAFSFSVRGQIANKLVDLEVKAPFFKLMDLAKDESDGSEDRLAEYIAGTKALMDNFYAADVKVLFEKVLSAQVIAKSGEAPNAGGNQGLKSLLFTSLSGMILKNLLALGGVSVDMNGDLHTQFNNFKNSPIQQGAFNHMFAHALAQKVDAITGFYDDKDAGLGKGMPDEVVKCMNSVIDAHLLVKKEDGKYKATVLLKNFRGSLRKFKEKLYEEKNWLDTLTYEEVAKQAGKIGGSKPLAAFDISAVREWIEKDYHKLLWFIDLRVKLSEILDNSSESVDFSDLLGDSSLADINDVLEAHRLAYVASKAPAPAA